MNNMFMDENVISFAIDTDITPDAYSGLIRFIHYHYLFPRMSRFVSIVSDNMRYISFVLPDPMGMWIVNYCALLFTL